jgi:NAD(P)H-quinone oxidoreductase subunit 5
MGFMMLACGLGAFHLALLHLVAHSFYKAHAFLSTGGVVKSKSNTTIQTIPTLAILGAVAVALTISILSAHWDSQPVLTGIFTIAMAQLFWTSWTRMQSFWLIPAGLLTGIVFSFGYFALDRLASELLMQSKVGPQWLAWPILLLFTLVALLQTQMPRLSQTTFGLHLYVHARNGFYINTLANRFTTWLWPTPAISTKGTV